ncbi:biotin--[acetyl-CoA-carboxylase] ligase [Synechococcus sp. H60.1]|uniref:biotin--[acetyl-CoA-carboxylase] ligase n=1 Tax=Synechococcus sp. H60.1 TaxID=2964517 RepID=UPI0039C3AA81
MLSPARLGSLVGRGAWGHHLLQVAVTDSTNRLLLDWGRRFPQPLPLGTVLVSTRQRAGQGQHGRVWQSPAGGLYLSVWLGSPPLRHSLLELTLTLAWGVAGSLRQRLGIPLQLKWPNDLVVVDEQCPGSLRKLGGLLVQSRFGERGQLLGLVAGVGVNVNNPVPAEGINLAEILGSRQDGTAVAAWVLQGMERGFQSWLQEGFAPVRSEYEAWAVKPQVRWPPGETLATVLGLARDGRLRVQTQGGLILVLAPDQVRLSYQLPIAGDPSFSAE